MEKDTRVFRYRKGESRIFASPEAVPAGEGWQDTPVPDEAPEAAADKTSPAAEPVGPVKVRKAKKASDGDSNGN